MIERMKRLWRAWKAPSGEGLAPEGRVVVTTSDRGLQAAYPDGSVQQVLWDDLVRLVIETNDSGPWGADVWWILEDTQGKCAYPQGATGEEEAMDAYKRRLDGFDWEAVVDAQGSTRNARFVCWSRT